MRPARLLDADYWRKRAEEARTQADEMRHPSAADLAGNRREL